MKNCFLIEIESYRNKTLEAEINCFFFVAEREVLKMNMGNPKRASRFVCCKHLGENYIGTGIQRYGHQREKFHCKDLFCLQCNEITKNVEIRWCDDYLEMLDYAQQIRSRYYTDKVENNNDRKVVDEYVL